MMKRGVLVGLFFTLFLLANWFSFSRENFSQEGVKKEEERGGNMGEGSPAVEIPPEKQQLIGVRKAEVRIQPFQKVIRTVGKIAYDERKLATVNIKVEGWIEKLYADYQGKYVKKGEKLADIYSPELYSTQLELVNLTQWKNEKIHRMQRNIEFTWGDRYGTVGRMLTFDLDSLIQVAKQKLRLWEISEERIQKLEESREAVKTFTLLSPISGYITLKQVVEGTRVLPGDRIFDIADLSTLWVIADLYAHELPLVREQQPAKIQLSHFPGKEFSTKIDYIYPTFSRETRTAKARFVLPNPDGVLKPEMFTDVEIRIDLGDRLAIPEDAVIDTGTRKIVYVDKGEGVFEPKEVVLGLRGQGIVEVAKGLKAGDKVAAEGTFLIDSEAKLKGVIPQ